MLTPFQIRDRVEVIVQTRKNARTHDAVARARVAREIFHLYRDVLLEVAKGSLDPRSLALAALEVEK